MNPDQPNDPLHTTDHTPEAMRPSPEAVPRQNGPAGASAPARPPEPDVTRTYRPGDAGEPTGEGSPDARTPSVPGYEILGVLGRGGMGVVYKARHLALKRTVALKMIRTGGHAGPGELARFRLEAEAVARLQHPNIVQVFEIGEAGGHPYCALEFVEGGSLAGKLAERPMPAAEAARLVQALARAMQLAHSRNVIHRDLKPANVLLSEDGTPKITDFGLARQLDGDSGETQAGAVMGTPSYMAPEQASGLSHEAGPAADVYALGAILYECLAGRPPFRGKTVLETLEQVRTQDPVPPSRLRPGIPPDLGTICLKCLRKEPEKRYSSAGELADELGRFLAGEPILARPAGRVERAWRWARRNPALAFLALGFVVVLAAATAISAWSAGEAIAQKQQADANAADARRETTVAEGHARAALAARDRAELLAYASQLRQAQLEIERGRPDDADALLRQAEPLLRGWEHAYLLRQANRGLWAAAHPGWVASLAFSADGRRLAAAGQDGTARAWDAATGRPAGREPGRGTGLPPGQVALSPDGTLLAWWGREGDVKAWEVTTGEERFSLAGRGGAASALALSHDGTRLAAGGVHGEVRIHDAATGKELLAWGGHADLVSGLEFSPDGRWLASSSRDGTARVWDARSGKERVTFRGHAGEAGGLDSVAFSPDGRRVASGGHMGRLKAWDAGTGEELAAFEGLPSHAHRLAFTRDGERLASGSWDGTVIVWEARTGLPLLRIRGHPTAVGSLAFSGDGQRLATGSAEDAVKVWDVRTGRDALTLRGDNSSLSGVATAGDGSRLATSCLDGTFKEWDVGTGEVRHAWKGQKIPPATCVAYSADGERVFAGGWIDGVTTFDVSAGKPGPALALEDSQVDCLAASLDGRLLVSGGEELKVWDARTLRHLLSLRGHEARVAGVAISPDGRRIASAGRDGAVKVWDAREGKELLALAGPAGGASSVAFSPDGLRLASGGGEVGEPGPGQLKVWDARTGEELLSLRGHTAFVSGVAFSPDGRRIASGSHDRTIKVWDAQAGLEVLTLRGHFDKVAAVAFSRDGQWLASASQDRTVKVWGAAGTH